jgi:hypothetical protein
MRKAAKDFSLIGVLLDAGTKQYKTEGGSALFLFSLALQPIAGYGLLVHEVS